jgi:glycosyltransferase involved in cell wall biosynthesis
MKVLTIGSDRKLFEKTSPVFGRVFDYAKEMDELHIIVFSLKKFSYQEISIGNLHIYPTNSTSRFDYIFDALKLGRTILGKKKFTRSDTVISAQDPFESGLVGFFLKREFHFPLQLQIHTDFQSPYFKNSILNSLRVFLGRFLIKKADGLRVVSTVIADSLRQKFPNLPLQVDVLPIWVDTDALSNAPIKKDIKVDFPQFNFIIFMASRLTKEKRIDVAIHALQKVLLKFTHVGLVIAGSGSEKRRLERLARVLGIAEHVRFIGWQDDLVSYYKTANLFLLTSEYEGYGMTLIEAGVSGCPILTTNVGIAKTDLFMHNENSYVCTVNDIDCLSQYIGELISDNAKRELFKQRMQDSIKNRAFSREQYIAEYVNLLQKLTEKVVPLP